MIADTPEAPRPREGREAGSLRTISLESPVLPYAEGSCMVAFGSTRVLCAASVEATVPSWRRGSGKGWITAEYAMLPRATRTRTSRERGSLGGRTQEIQRLIGRSMRAMVDGFDFGEFTIRVDCDVLQADGGTRTAAITGAAVAVCGAFGWLVDQGQMEVSPVRRLVAAASVGVVDGEPRLDLDYEEDVRAAVDMNVVMSDEGRFVEVQGTGEQGTFTRDELDALLGLASSGIEALQEMQHAAMHRAGISWGGGSR